MAYGVKEEENVKQKTALSKARWAVGNVISTLLTYLFHPLQKIRRRWMALRK